ncbi:MAG: hypothetical protein Kow0068_16820 [Marinilabiliales bacterium]
MDTSIVTIDTENKKLYYAGANNPLYLIRNNELIEYKADKMPVSIYYKMKLFTQHEISYQENDMIFLFSDDYPDQFGGIAGKK